MMEQKGKEKSEREDHKITPLRNFLCIRIHLRVA